MVCFTVTLEIAPEHREEARRTLAQLTHASRSEPGCILYIAHESEETPGRFMIYEQYQDPAAVDAHRASAHFQQLAAGRLYKLISSRAAENFTVLA